MKIVIITQNAPIYWPRFIHRLISKLTHKEQNNKTPDISIAGILALSPIKKRSLIKEIKHQLAGLGFLQLLKMFFIMFHAITSIVLDNIFPQSLNKQPATIKNICRKFNLIFLNKKGFDSVNSSDFINWVKENDIDIIISAGAPEIFKKEILSAPKLSCINVHTGYLPGYAGRKPLFWTLFNDEKSAGITIHIMTEEVDNGPILERQTFSISKTDTLHTLTLKSMDFAADVLFKTLNSPSFYEILQSSYNGHSPTPKSIPIHMPTILDKKLFRQKGKRFY